MVDAWHVWGADLSIGPTGDIRVVDGAVSGQQRVLRRLMTNPGDYLWNLTYGAGLGALVGQPILTAQVGALVRDQMFMEQSVGRDPEPVISMQIPDDDPENITFLEIHYTDKDSGDTQIMNVVRPGRLP